MRHDPRPPRTRRPRPHSTRSGHHDGRPAREPRGRAAGCPRGRDGPPDAPVSQAMGPLVCAPPGAFDEDLVLRLLAADGYELHRLVYGALACDGERGFLFAPVAVRGPAHRVFVRPCGIATRFAHGQQFALALRAWPTVKHANRRRSIGAARNRDPLRLRWIHTRAQEHGFRLLDEPRMSVERVRISKPGHAFSFNACLYRARIAVTDPARFTHAYTRGIGQGRAWGCGMIILAETATP